MCVSLFLWIGLTTFSVWYPLYCGRVRLPKTFICKGSIWVPFLTCPHPHGCHSLFRRGQTKQYCNESEQAAQSWRPHDTMRLGAHLHGCRKDLHHCSWSGGAETFLTVKSFDYMHCVIDCMAPIMVKVVVGGGGLVTAGRNSKIQNVPSPVGGVSL